MTDSSVTAIVATGVSCGAIAKNEHARIAVENAIEKLGSQTIAGVLLFLTTAYAHCPEEAIREAAKAAGTTQVTGCCANGIFTEESSVTNQEGAVAMAFTQEYWFRPYTLAKQAQLKIPLTLCLSSPNAAHLAIDAINHPQFGVISSDEYGDGPFSIWQSGRVSSMEYIHAAFPANCRFETVIGGGIKPLSPLLEIQKSTPYSISTIAGESALDSLHKYSQAVVSSTGRKMHHIIAGLTSSNNLDGIQLGQHQTAQIVSADDELGILNLSLELDPARDKYLFWGIRDEEYIRQTMRLRIQTLTEQTQAAPCFGILFSNLSRGGTLDNEPEFDRALLSSHFAGLPIIGCYGNGEIAPHFDQGSEIVSQSSVFTLVY